ncbi:hypothetical protein GJ496_002418 [Pomphorhynchus laevis]|nr:hypothetical protein GJ496_002418 [Pomphorhynchus laevis]
MCQLHFAYECGLEDKEDSTTIENEYQTNFLKQGTEIIFNNSNVNPNLNKQSWDICDPQIKTPESFVNSSMLRQSFRTRRVPVRYIDENRKQKISGE